MATLDVLIDTLSRSAAAEEAYARGLQDAARSCGPSSLRGTGQGVSAAVDTGRLDFAWAAHAHDERDRLD